MLISLHMCKYSFMDVYRCVRIFYVIFINSFKIEFITSKTTCNLIDFLDTVLIKV